MCPWYYCVLFVGVISFNTQSSAIVVETECGKVEGLTESDGITSFKGIPYAVPPIGPLRWQRPLRLKENDTCWQGTYQAYDYGDQCIQYDIIYGWIDGNENCLFMNVWTTVPFNTTLKPVMVFIHGGSLVAGSGSTIGMVPSNLVLEGVVSVSFNYRLGVLGFLALPELTLADPLNISGNYGFFDQIIALKWIQNNIQHFGGDPQRITIWGQSSGGSSVLALLSSPLARGLFQGAISMSASPRNGQPLTVVESLNVAQFLPSTPCHSLHGQSLLDCLYAMPAQDLLSSTSKAWNPTWPMGLPSPVDTIMPFLSIDGYIFQKNFSEVFQTGDYMDVPIIFGNMHDEVDIQPVDDVIDMSEDEYIPFLDNKFTVWGDGFVRDVLNLYPIENFLSQQQHYDSIAADTRTICGNIELAKNAAKSHQKGLIYYYIGVQTPTVRQCLFDLPSYCARYSFHCFDLFAINHFLVPLLEPDLEFGNLVRDVFTEFAHFGKINRTGWEPISNFGNATDYNVVLLALDGRVAVNYKKDVCQFWQSHGFDQFQWQN